MNFETPEGFYFFTGRGLMNHITHANMNKKIVHLIMACLSVITFASCDGVQDRRFTYHSEFQTEDAGPPSQTVPPAETAQNADINTEVTQTDSGEQDSSAVTQNGGEKIISFDLPDGWSRDEDNSSNRAMWLHESEDGIKPYVMMEVYIEKEGTREEAQTYAKEDNDKRVRGCIEDPCEYQPGYEEKNIAGVDVFISTDVSHYWGA
jgi:hypothetical protein